jgi:hypothetical protein
MMNDTERVRLEEEIERYANRGVLGENQTVTIRFGDEVRTVSEKGTVLAEALREMIREALPEAGEAKIEGMIREITAQFGGVLPYEVSYAVVLEDGQLKARLSKKAEIAFDRSGKIMYMSSTETISPDDRVVFRGHTHPHVAEGPLAELEFSADVCAMMARERIYGRDRVLPEYIFQRTAEGGVRLKVLMPAAQAQGRYVFADAKEFKNGVPVPATEGARTAVEADVLKDAPAVTLGLKKLDAWETGHVMARPARGDSLIERVQEMANLVWCQGVAQELIAQLGQRGLDVQKLKSLREKDPNSFAYELIAILKEAGFLTTNYATVVDVRAFGTEGIEEVAKRLGGRESPVKLYFAADAQSRGKISNALVRAGIREGDVADMIIDVGNERGDDLLKTISRELPLRLKDIKNSHVSIALADSDENRGAIERHLTTRDREGSFNFLIADEVEVRRSLVQDRITYLNLYNVLASMATKNINIMAIGCKESIGSYLENLRRTLRNVLRYIIIGRQDIEREMREFINTFHQVSTAM